MKKSIIISGASGNLGQEIVKKLSEDGNSLSLSVSERTQNEFLHLVNTYSQVVNLTNEQDSENFVNDSFEKLRTIHAAVLLVGGYAMGDIKETSNQDLMNMINVNFFTAFNLVRPLLKHFERQGFGQIILVSSKASFEFEKGASSFAYTFSKAMLNDLASFINATNKYVTVQIIVPSTIDTPVNRKASPDADYAKWVTTETISKTINFLLSETGSQLKETVLKIYNQA